MKSALMGTRRDILELLSKQELTVAELAEALEITPAGVRQHVTPLEALGWIEHDREVQGAHRPTHRYRLTEEGQRAFPKRYDLLLGEVLEVLLTHQTPAQVQGIVRQAAQRVAQRARSELSGASPAAQWKSAVQWLEREMAWQADVTESKDGARRFTIHQCPFRDVSRAHPELCGAFFTTLIAELSGRPPGQHQPAASG